MKKAFTAIVVIVVIVGLIASYVFTGFTPAPAPQTTEQGVSADATAGMPQLPFTGPVGEPSVKGPTAPPGALQ